MVLTEVGIECVALHSMISQRLRLAALTKFKSSRAKIMVATDVGSRYVNQRKSQLICKMLLTLVIAECLDPVGR